MKPPTDIGTIAVSTESRAVFEAPHSAVDTPHSSIGENHEIEVLPVLEERMTVAKRKVAAGKIRVSTRTEFREEFAEIALDRNVVEVTRVAIGEIIDAAPEVRIEGDTTIVPVVEERFIIVKQLYLKEEIRIRNSVESKLTRTSVQLRQQTAAVERMDADGQLISEGSEPQTRDEKSR